MSWITVVPIVHVAKRRIGRLLPLRVEPGRKFILGSETKIRNRPYTVCGVGYEDEMPVVHVRRAPR